MKSSTIVYCSWALVAGLAPMVQAFVPTVPAAGIARRTNVTGAKKSGEDISPDDLGVAAVTTGGIAIAPTPTEADETRTSTATARALLALEDVRWTTEEWLRIVTSGTETAPEDTAALYAKDAALWGTVSEEVRNTPESILEYFKFFAKLPDLSVARYRPYARMVTETVAINTGYYTFSWQPEGEETRKEVNARYSFTYRQDHSIRSGWAIVDHHSSGVPTQPADLPSLSF